MTSGSQAVSGRLETVESSRVQPGPAPNAEPYGKTSRLLLASRPHISLRPRNTAIFLSPSFRHLTCSDRRGEDDFCGGRCGAVRDRQSRSWPRSSDGRGVGEMDTGEGPDWQPGSRPRPHHAPAPSSGSRPAAVFTESRTEGREQPPIQPGLEIGGNAFTFRARSLPPSMSIGEVIRRKGVACGRSRFTRAVVWRRDRSDPTDGDWPAAGRRAPCEPCESRPR